jgi:hypothetical protein
VKYDLDSRRGDRRNYKVFLRIGRLQRPGWRGPAGPLWHLGLRAKGASEQHDDGPGEPPLDRQHGLAIARLVGLPLKVQALVETVLDGEAHHPSVLRQVVIEAGIDGLETV